MENLLHFTQQSSVASQTVEALLDCPLLHTPTLGKPYLSVQQGCGFSPEIQIKQREVWRFSLGLCPPPPTPSWESPYWESKIITNTGHWNKNKRTHFWPIFALSHDCLTPFQVNGCCKPDQCLFHWRVLSSAHKATMVYKEEQWGSKQFLSQAWWLKTILLYALQCETT